MTRDGWEFGTFRLAEPIRDAARVYLEGVRRGYTAPVARADSAIPDIAEAVAAERERIAEAVRGDA
jgi:hypothetical protein